MNWHDEDGLRERYIQLGVEVREESHRLIAHERVHWHVEHEWGLLLALEEGLAEMLGAVRLPSERPSSLSAVQNGLYGLQSDAPILRNARPLQIDRSSWRELSA